MNTFLKTLRTTPTTVLLLVLGITPELTAAPATAPQANPKPVPQNPAAVPPERVSKDHALINRAVFDANNKRLGQLDDFVVAADSGEILYGIIGTTGGLRAVPFSVLTPEYAPGNPMRLRLAVTEQAWNDLPRFEKRNLDQLRAGTPRQQDLYRRFTLQPVVTYPGEQQRLALASETVGKSLQRANQVIGRIEDVLVHLESQIATILLAPTTRPDEAAAGQKFILPFYGITYSRDDDAFSTTLDASQFTAVRSPTTPEQAMNIPAAGSPYQWSAYGASATIIPPAPPAFQGRDLSASRPPVREIREALASDPNTRYTRVNVLAASDRVILRGQVQDEDDKRRVETRAAQVAGGWRIDNQLRIASASATEE